MPRGFTIFGAIVIVSLALNLFLAGSLVGRQVHGFFGMPMPPPPPFAGIDFNDRLDAVSWRLPEADQKIVRDIIDAHRAEVVGKWHTVRSAGARVNATLQATPFQAEDAKAAFEKWNQSNMDLRSAVQQLQLEAAAKISPDGRDRIRWRLGQ